MRIVKRDRILNDTSSLVLFTSVANNDIYRCSALKGLTEDALRLVLRMSLVRISGTPRRVSAITGAQQRVR